MPYIPLLAFYTIFKMFGNCFLVKNEFLSEKMNIFIYSNKKSGGFV